ncbi:MAG TPA: GNAT family N-acetyltransferase [Thermoplasmata archaeon]|nr:GNAT family N-acetyltransferase [Thermoplasmata archaeon]
MAAARAGEFTVRPLSEESWPAFERLFGRFGGVQAGCWCFFYHRPGPIGEPSDARTDQNRKVHRAMVAEGRARGILVFHEEEPVGWCQYGRPDELPRIDAGRKYRALRSGGHGLPDWRITCFFVDPKQRHRGAARVALRAALEAIRTSGGGLVEAYPVTGRSAVASWFGSTSMFEREGFRHVAPFGRSNRLLQRRVSAARSRPRVTSSARARPKRPPPKAR